MKKLSSQDKQVIAIQVVCILVLYLFEILVILANGLVGMIFLISTTVLLGIGIEIQLRHRKNSNTQNGDIKFPQNANIPRDSTKCTSDYPDNPSVDWYLTYIKNKVVDCKISNIDSPDAVFVLGSCYFEGIFVKKDNEKAIALWKNAADNGSKDALAKLQQHYNSSTKA